MSYSLMSSVGPSKYFSQMKFSVLTRLADRPKVSDLRSEASSARSASKLLTVDSTAHPGKSCNHLNRLQWVEYNSTLEVSSPRCPGREPHFTGAIECDTSRGDSR